MNKKQHEVFPKKRSKDTVFVRSQKHHQKKLLENTSQSETTDFEFNKVLFLVHAIGGIDGKLIENAEKKEGDI